MTAATQLATPAAPNNNEPVRVNHTARNVIITIVVVAIIAVAAFFGYRAFAGANESSAKGSKGNPVKIGRGRRYQPRMGQVQAERREGRHLRRHRRLPGLHLRKPGP